MIDRSIFTVERFLNALLDDVDPWRKRAEILPAYVPPFADPGRKPECRVRCAGVFLRYSKGPRQGYSWDIVGDDFLTPEIALLALCQAPPPPGLLHNPEE